MTMHNLTDVQSYPNFHFSVIRKGELYIQSNIPIQTNDSVKVGKEVFKIKEIVKVEDTVNELTGYWDTQGSGKNLKRKWVLPINNYIKHVTKYYTTLIEKI